MSITNKSIKSILNDNYNRTLGKVACDSYADKDSLNELACILWEREDRKLESELDEREQSIASELERFKKLFMALKSRLEIFGDSGMLRRDIIYHMNEYKQFLEAI